MLDFWRSALPSKVKLNLDQFIYKVIRNHCQECKIYYEIFRISLQMFFSFWSFLLWKTWTPNIFRVSDATSTDFKPFTAATCILSMHQYQQFHIWKRLNLILNNLKIIQQNSEFHGRFLVFEKECSICPSWP